MAQQQAADSEARSPRPSRGSSTVRLGAPGLTRDKLLGYGAAAGALLALVSLTIANVIILVVLGYAAFAFIGPQEKRDRRLRMGGWAAAALTLFMAIMVAILLGYAISHPEEGDVSLAAYLPLGSATLVLATTSTLVLSLTAALGAMAFGRTGAERYRLMGLAALCATFYFVILLPATVVGTEGFSRLGSFWSTPLRYGGVLFDILATTTVACAFLWTSGHEEHGAATGAGRFTRADREYLLFAAAISLVLTQILDLATVDWSLLGNTGDAAAADVFAARAAYIARAVLPLVLSVAAAIAFWMSSRRAGWIPRRWSDSSRAAGGPATDASTTADAATTIETSPLVANSGARLPLARAAGLLLTWRLPWLYAWLVALMIACSFLGWYGFLAAVPAAVNYLWMSLRASTP